MNFSLVPGFQASIEQDCRDEPRILHLRGERPLPPELLAFFGSLGELRRLTPSLGWIEAQGLCKLYLIADHSARVVFRTRVDRRTIYEFLGHCVALLSGHDDGPFAFLPPTQVQPCPTPSPMTC